MEIQGIAAQLALSPIAAPSQAGVASLQGESAAAAGGAAFADMVLQGLNGVNQQLMTSQADLQRLALGDTANLHQVMVNLEESRLSFQLLMQVRNRALEAYQDIMKMQI